MSNPFLKDKSFTGKKSGKWAKKHLGTPDYTGDDIKKEVKEGYAIPELRYKLDIFVTQNEMIQANRLLRRNMKLNNNQINPNDQAELEASIIALFDFIKDMSLSQVSFKSMNRINQDCFRMLVDLQFNKRSFTYKELVMMMNFLLNRLHSLGLTNLLRSDTPHLEDFFEE